MILLNIRELYKITYLSKLSMAIQLTILRERPTLTCLLTFVFFKKWANSGFFFIYFRSFSNKQYNFYNKSIGKKCPSSIRRRDSNPQPLKHESLPISTRPGLPPNADICLCHNKVQQSKIYTKRKF